MAVDRKKISAALEEEIEELLAALGFDDIRQNANSYRGVAHCHEDADNPSGFVYYPDQGKWMCFTNQCHTQHGSDLVGLIMSVLGCSFKKAIDFAQQFIEGKDLSGVEVRKRQRIDYWQLHLGQPTFNDKVLSKLHSADGYASERSFQKEVFHSYGIGFAKTGSMVGRVVVPVRNIKGQIVGFTGRKVYDNMKFSDGTEAPKWWHCVQRNLNLFNIDRIKQRRLNSVIVVEGPWDVLRLEENEIKNSVAILGKYLTLGQIEILSQAGVFEVIMGLDNDGTVREKDEKNTIDTLKKHLFIVSSVKPTEGKDWGEMTPEEIQKSMQEKVVL